MGLTLGEMKMTAAEFKSAFKLAESDVDLSKEDIGIFDGYALSNFEPVVATIRQVAQLIRWQAQYLNGGWNAEELTEIKTLFRKRVTMVG